MASLSQRRPGMEMAVRFSRVTNPRGARNRLEATASPPREDCAGALRRVVPPPGGRLRAFHRRYAAFQPGRISPTEPHGGRALNVLRTKIYEP